MNAIHSPIHPTLTATGDRGNENSAAAAGLPDFAALLGLALAEPCQAQTGAEQSGTEGMDPECVALLAGEEKADRQGMDDDEIAPASAAAEMAGAFQAAAQASVPAGLNEAASAEANGNNPVAEPSGKNEPRPQIIKMEAPQVQAPTAPQEQQAQAWNVRELLHHIKAAAGTLGLGEAQAKGPAPAAAAGTIPAQAQADRIRAAGTQNLQRASMNPEQAETENTPQGLVLAVAAGSETQDGAGQFFTAPDPRFKNALALGTAAGLKDKTAAQDFEAPQASATPLGNNAQPGIFTWAPEAHAAQAGQTVPMAEQMRQVADIMAERTEGVIRLGQDSVQAHLRLQPGELGGVRVQLSVGADGTTQTRFIAERPETAALLQQNLRTYQQGLEGHGLKVESVQVMVQSARPASAGPDTGWRQQGGPDDMRRDGTGFENRRQQKPDDRNQKSE